MTVSPLACASSQKDRQLRILQLRHRQNQSQRVSGESNVEVGHCLQQAIRSELALGAGRQQWTSQFSAYHFQSHRLYHSKKDNLLISARDISTNQIEVVVEIDKNITNADCAFAESEGRQVGMQPAAGRVKLRSPSK